MFFDIKNISVLPDGKGYIKIKFQDGSEIRRIRLKRLFPLTGGDSYIRMITPDGKEAGIIKNLNELEPESQKYALNALNHYYIIPKILEIHSLYDSHGSLFWEVETDKGEREFSVANRYRDISEFPSGKMVIRDTDDNQYEIPNYDSLPAKSRKLLEPWL
jgi:hypothetical protein